MEQQHNNNDEIDLLELFNNLLKSTYFFFNRWYKTMAIVTLIGFILGVAVYFKDKDKYHNNITGYSPVINPVLVVDIINSLNEANKADKESMQKLLNLTVIESGSLLGFHADTIETLSNNLKTISIELLYKDSLDCSKFEKNLISYINNNQYVAKNLTIHKNRLNVYIKQTEKEITKLDSLQLTLLKNAGKKPGLKNGTLMISNDQIANFYHKDILDLTKTIESYRSDLEHITGFEIINSSESVKIKSRSLFKTVAIFAGIALGLSFFVLLGIEIRRKAVQLINRK